MTNHKNIHNIFESWGASKREYPLNNENIKQQVLSKVGTGKNLELPRAFYPSLWFSYAFTTVAVIILLVNFGNGKTSQDFAVSGGAIVIPPMATVTNEYDKNYDEEAQVSMTSNMAKKVGYSPAGVAMTDEYSVTNATAPAPDMYMYEPIRQSSPVADNREFLKINYNATLKTRRVPDLMNRTEIAIRGFNGRVDSLSNSDKWGHVSFAMPKNKFDAFREEITSMVGSRFLVEQTDSQNLLSTKQVIEENQKQVDTKLTQLRNDRTQVVKNHNQNISLYQMRVSSLSLEITTLRIEYKTAAGIRQAEILNRINEIQVEIGNIESEIINENASYNSKLGRLDSQIKSYGEASKEIREQDGDLIDDVDTVTGTISFKRISLWEMVDTYVPGPFLAWILFTLAIVAYLWHRKCVVAW